MNQEESDTEKAAQDGLSASSSTRRIQVCLNRVSHRFGGRTVFDNLSASISSGKTGIITGSNGSGKSTLLRIIAGLLEADSGDVTFEADGAYLDNQMRRQMIGMVAPDLTLYKELTGAENLTFFASLKGINADRAMLVEALTEVGLRGRGRDLVGGYSSGMRQRLKYAFALLGRPKVLLLDEPTANLDADGMEMVERIVRCHQARTDGALTIVATNEPRETNWGEPLIHLERGE